MNGYLLDTNVVSEIRRPQPEARVLAWLDSIDPELFYLSVMTLGEIRTGIDRMPEGKQRRFLNDWFANELRPWLAGRILSVNEAIAERWGALDAQQTRQGRPLNIADGIIAATAAEHGLTVVTRNVDHFRNLGVPLFNPWDARTLEPRWPQAREEKAAPAEPERDAPDQDIEH